MGTGVLGQTTIGYAQMLADADVVLEGSLRRLAHPDLHVYVLELDVARVLRGELTLTPDNTPLRILVSAFGNHRRWILTDWEPGTRVTVFASEGEVFYESRRLIVRGLCVDGDAAWPTTGREEALVETLAPLALRDPDALLASLQADDEVHRWLATVRAMWLCRDLGDPFPYWPKFGSCALRKERVEGMRQSILEALVTVRERLVWDRAEDRYRVVEEQGKD